jgi:hypothetical protein
MRRPSSNQSLVQGQGVSHVSMDIKILFGLRRMFRFYGVKPEGLGVDIWIAIWASIEKRSPG